MTVEAAGGGGSRLSDWLRRAAASGQLREIVLFLCVGGTSALIYIGLNVAFTWLGVRPALSIICTLSLLIPPTYLAQRRFTFRSERNHAAAFPRYLGTQLVGNVVPLVAAELFPAVIRQHALVAYFIIAVVVAATNYGVLKFWAFRGVA